jgi:hypothetical protein
MERRVHVRINRVQSTTPRSSSIRMATIWRRSSAAAEGSFPPPQADWAPTVTDFSALLIPAAPSQAAELVESRSCGPAKACERNNLGYAPFTRVHGLLVSSV